MSIKALLIDFRVITPAAFSYQTAIAEITKAYPDAAKSSPNNIFSQIEIVKEKAAKEEFESFTAKITKMMDEAEKGITNFPLNMGVKNGLSELDSLDVKVVAVTEMGKEPAEKYLKENEIDGFIGKLVSREKLGEPFDLRSRLNRALVDEEFKQEECVYFCNRLSDLKQAKASNFRTVVLPSKGERLDLMMLEKPMGMIMSLEEVPNLLALEIARSAKGKPAQSAEQIEEAKGDSAQTEREEDDSSSSESESSPPDEMRGVGFEPTNP